MKRENTCTSPNLECTALYISLTYLGRHLDLSMAQTHFDSSLLRTYHSGHQKCCGSSRCTFPCPAEARRCSCLHARYIHILKGWIDVAIVVDMQELSNLKFKFISTCMLYMHFVILSRGVQLSVCMLVTFTFCKHPKGWGETVLLLIDLYIFFAFLF